jgi:hypothetical protein
MVGVKPGRRPDMCKLAVSRLPLTMADRVQCQTVHVGFMANEVALGKVSLPVL